MKFMYIFVFLLKALPIQIQMILILFIRKIFLYRNSFKDVFLSNKSSSYLILLQNVMTKFYYLVYSSVTTKKIKEVDLALLNHNIT